MSYIKYIQNEQHGKEVLGRIRSVRESLWIGTADIKDLYLGDEPLLGVLAELIERVLCPRVHFKMMIFDFEAAYVGSANLTGAGIGMKGSNKRNFEAGILTLYIYS